MNHASEHFKHANQFQVETLASVANTALGAVEQIAALNLSTVRNFLQQRESGSRRMLAAADTQTLFSLQAGVMLEEARNAMSYSRRAIEISTQTRDELARVLGKGITPPF